MRIGIVGSRQYQNASKVRKYIYELKGRVGDDLVIVSGGQPAGADGYAKKYALEFSVEYVEFPPAHYSYNQHCINEAHHYGKAYRPYNFFQRNSEIAEYSDIIIAFIPPNTILEDSHGTHDTCKKALKLDKKVIVIN